MNPKWRISLSAIKADLLNDGELDITLRVGCVDTDNTNCSLISPIGAFIALLTTSSTVIILESKDFNFYTSFIGRNHYIKEQAFESNSTQHESKVSRE